MQMKYNIMYNVHDIIVLYNNTIRFGYKYFTHMYENTRMTTSFH